MAARIHHATSVVVASVVGTTARSPNAMLYALESVGGVRGTLADAFGVYADLVIGAAPRDVLLRP